MSPSAGAGASSEVTQHYANTSDRPVEESKKQEGPEAVAEIDAACRRMDDARTRRLEQELTELRAKTACLRHSEQPAAAGTAPEQPDAAADATNEAAQFLQFMRENQALMAQQNQALLNVISGIQQQQPVAPAPPPPTRPQIEFPAWDGSEATKADFIFRIRIGTMKQYAFFQTVTDWSHAAPGLEAQNNYLQANIVDKVPIKHFL